jgi:hypothetical protein
VVHLVVRRHRNVGVNRRPGRRHYSVSSLLGARRRAHRRVGGDRDSLDAADAARDEGRRGDGRAGHIRGGVCGLDGSLLSAGGRLGLRGRGGLGLGLDAAGSGGGLVSAGSRLSRLLRGGEDGWLDVPGGVCGLYGSLLSAGGRLGLRGEGGLGLGLDAAGGEGGLLSAGGRLGLRSIGGPRKGEKITQVRGRFGGDGSSRLAAAGRDRGLGGKKATKDGSNTTDDRRHGRHDLLDRFGDDGVDKILVQQGETGLHQFGDVVVGLELSKDGELVERLGERDGRGRNTDLQRRHLVERVLLNTAHADNPPQSALEEGNDILGLQRRASSLEQSIAHENSTGNIHLHHVLNVRVTQNRCRSAVESIRAEGRGGSGAVHVLRRLSGLGDGASARRNVRSVSVVRGLVEVDLNRCTGRKLGSIVSHVGNPLAALQAAVPLNLVVGVGIAVEKVDLRSGESGKSRGVAPVGNRNLAVRVTEIPDGVRGGDFSGGVVSAIGMTERRKRSVDVITVIAANLAGKGSRSRAGIDHTAGVHSLVHSNQTVNVAVVHPEDRIESRVGNGSHVAPLSTSIDVNTVVDRLNTVPAVGRTVDVAHGSREVAEVGNAEQGIGSGPAAGVVTVHRGIDQSVVAGRKRRIRRLAASVRRVLELVTEVLLSQGIILEFVLAKRVVDGDGLGNASSTRASDSDGSLLELGGLTSLKIGGGPVPVRQTDIPGSSLPSGGLVSLEFGGNIDRMLHQALLKESQIRPKAPLCQSNTTPPVQAMEFLPVPCGKEHRDVRAVTGASILCADRCLLPRNERDSVNTRDLVIRERVGLRLV